MSSILQSALLATSTSPRSSRAYLERLARDATPPEPHVVIYQEGKALLAEAHTDAARVLLARCPIEFGNTRGYLTRMSMYDDLCTAGLIERPGICDVRQLLSQLLHEDPGEPRLVAYADRLVRHGYNCAALRGLTTASVGRAMACANMAEGHCCLLEAHAVANTPLFERFVTYVVTTTERCAGVVKCVGGLRDASKKEDTTTAKARKVSDDTSVAPTDDDDDATSDDIDV